MGNLLFNSYKYKSIMSSEKQAERPGEGDGSFSFRAAAESQPEAGAEPPAEANVVSVDDVQVKEAPKAKEAGTKDKLPSNLPEPPRPHDQQTVLTDFKKNQQYYNDLELNMEDLDKIEERVQEMERYLGIEGINDIQYFIKNDIEKLDQKCIRLDDFIKVIEDKNFMLNDLYTKFDQLENFLKNGNRFTTQCMDLQTRAKMVEESDEHIEQFTKSLGKVQQLENYLNFQPVIEPKQKLEQLKELDTTHLRQLIKSEENTKEIEDLLTNYNEMVQ